MRQRSELALKKKSWPDPWHDLNAFSYQGANACALYCDADAYFKAFIKAAEKAESHIYILGWDIHTATNLAPDLDPDGLEWSLDIFLRRLLETKENLQIYILGWDFSPVFFLEREKLQSLRFSWSHHPRLHFLLDAHHPLGGSHHQKIIVVDEHLAFLGGLDLTIRRWDQASHQANDPLRKDPDGEAYAPFHDLQIGITGPSAEPLAHLFRERWLRATGSRIKVAARHATDQACIELPEQEALASFKNAPVALSRTSPLFRDYREVKEIARLYTDLLRLAKRSIYIENQYLTSQLIVDLLCEIGRKVEGPEIVIILPKKSGGWLEKRTMGLLQASALQKILASDAHGRAQVYFPFDHAIQRDKKYITVHSKLLIVDDIYLCVGSANLNNRSMGFDTECNATIDASQSPELRREVRGALAYFLSHFSDVNRAHVAQLIEAATPLRKIVEDLRNLSPQRHLAPFEISADSGEAWLDAELLDMEATAPIEIAMDRWAKMSDAINRRIGVSPRTVALILTACVGLLLAALWSFTSLPDYLNLAGMQQLLHTYEAGQWRTFLVLPLIFAIGGLVFFPINLLIIGTASLFPMAWAFAYIALGVTANTVAAYLIGRFTGKYFFRQFFGRRTRDVLNRIGEGHFIAIVLLRIVPIAPASVINLAAGAGRIPLLKFLAATLVGMMPGTLMLVIFQRSIIDLFKKPSWSTVFVVLLLSGIALGLYRWSKTRFSNYRT